MLFAADEKRQAASCRARLSRDQGTALGSEKRATILLHAFPHYTAYIFVVKCLSSIHAQMPAKEWLSFALIS